MGISFLEHTFILKSQSLPGSSPYKMSTCVYKNFLLLVFFPFPAYSHFLPSFRTWSVITVNSDNSFFNYLILKPSLSLSAIMLLPFLSWTWDLIEYMYQSITLQCITMYHDYVNFLKKILYSKHHLCTDLFTNAVWRTIVIFRIRVSMCKTWDNMITTALNQVYFHLILPKKTSFYSLIIFLQHYLEGLYCTPLHMQKFI